MTVFFLKHLRLFVNISLCCIALSACDNEDAPVSFYTTLGTVAETDGKKVIISDSYGTLFPENENYLTAKDADSIGQRVLAGVQFLGNIPSKEATEGSEIQIVELYKILTKAADDLRGKPEDADIFGEDPVKITSYNIGNGHLTIEFIIWGYDESIRHRISLVRTNEDNSQSNDYITLEFRHNSNGDLTRVPYSGIVSFPLKSIEGFESTECKGLTISYNDAGIQQTTIRINKESSETKTYKNTNSHNRGMYF